MSDQVFSQQRRHVKKLERQLATTDFGVRMRNKMTIELAADEQIVEDLEAALAGYSAIAEFLGPAGGES